MSVLVRWMEMPKNCNKCPLKNWCYKDHVEEVLIVGRPVWCPVVEFREPCPSAKQCHRHQWIHDLLDKILNEEE